MDSLAKAIPEQSFAATLHEAQVSASLQSSQMMLSRKRKLSEICDPKQESKASVKMLRLNDGTKVVVKQSALPSRSDDQANFAKKTIQAKETKQEEQSSSLKMTESETVHPCACGE